VLLIERMMSWVVGFIACDLFGLDSRDVTRARRVHSGDPRPPQRDRQVIVRFGR
jgi:hypothetical protein